ncbi:MAG: CoA transferase subunit A [Candidatus Bathyarchaeota archaeon]|nr:MAG: CoA transferase subunit A [Candidatus Bathyarchaeota archaeon]
MRRDNKIVTTEEAIKKFVLNGDTVFLGGFAHLYPYAFVHEMIRQKKENLTLCKHSPELMADMMIGAGVLRKLIFGWFGNPGVGSSHCFRRAVEKEIPQALEIEEYTHFALTTRLKAASMGLPFLPTRSIIGSDLAKYNPNIKFMDCPFSDEKLCVVPAIHPDVAFINVQRADAFGNSQIWGAIGDIREGAFASKKVIVSAEEIVSTEVIRRDPNRTVIPGFLVDVVVEEPWGSHPSYAMGYYDRDNDFYIDYGSRTRTVEGFEEYLNEWIYGVDNRREYIRKLGAEKLLKLKPKSFMSFAVDYGYYP